MHIDKQESQDMVMTQIGSYCCCVKNAHCKAAIVMSCHGEEKKNQERQPMAMNVAHFACYILNVQGSIPNS